MISNPEVNRTLATLRKAEFGFLGVIVEKLTDKSPLLSLYRTVHEIFTSYGSSFNSFEVIGSILGARRRGDSYHLDLVLLPLFFFYNTESVLLLPVSNRAC